MFSPTHQKLFFTKNDTSDIRLGDLFKSYIDEPLHNNDIMIFGYPDDEGIKNNGGRIGAAEAPDRIRQFLYKLTPPFHSKYKPADTVAFYDYGNLETLGSLDKKMTSAEKAVLPILGQKVRVVCLGGGHDYGYADGAAFIESHATASQKPLIINFDAHLDVRPDNNGINSGTSFYKLLKKYKGQFDLVEIGIQKHCNSAHQWKWAIEQGAHIITLDEIESDGWESIYDHKLHPHLNFLRPVFISFDIDCITTAEAGGCSQAWPTGLKVSETLALLKKIYLKTNTRGLGIYEVSPAFDKDFQTCKLAALLAYQFIFQHLESES